MLLFALTASANPIGQRARQTCQRRRGNAFSLIELIVVLLLVSIVAAVGSTRYAEALSHHRAQRRAQQIAAQIQAARQAARSRSQIVSLAFDTVAERYTVTGVANPDHPTLPFVVNLAEGPLTAQLSASELWR